MMHLFKFAVCILVALHTAVAAVDGALISIAPPSSTVLVGIDAQRAVASRSGNAILWQTIEAQGLVRLLAAVGLNAHRDIRQMLLAGTGQHSDAALQYAVLAEGNYNPVRLIAAGKLKGALVRRYGAVTVIALGTGNTASAVAFLKPGFLVMGNLVTVQNMLASETHSHLRGIDPTLRSQINRIGPGNDVWYATTLSGSFLGQQVADALPSELRHSRALEAISRSSGGLQFGSTDKISLDLVASSPGNARLLSDVLQVAGRVARLKFGSDAGLVLAANVLSSMQVSLEASTVHCISEVPDEPLERALTSPK